MLEIYLFHDSILISALTKSLQINPKPNPNRMQRKNFSTICEQYFSHKNHPNFPRPVAGMMEPISGKPPVPSESSRRGESTVQISAQSEPVCPVNFTPKNPIFPSKVSSRAPLLRSVSEWLHLKHLLMTVLLPPVHLQAVAPIHRHRRLKSRCNCSRKWRVQFLQFRSLHAMFVRLGTRSVLPLSR